MTVDEEIVVNKSGDEAQNASSQPKLDNQKFLLKERFEIDFSRPLVWLDNNGGKAFAVSDRIDTTRRLFALICCGETPPRLSILPYLKSIENSALMKLVEYGIVTYSPDNAQKMALIYEEPLGGKVFDAGICSLSLKEAPEKFRTLALSFMGVIDAFKNMNITHRAIRTDNLYFRDVGKSEIVIGDCAAAFPAFFQPPAFEAIESLYADKVAHGNGSDKSDIYSAAVTLTCMVLGHDILQNVSAPEVLRQKIKKGSLALINSIEKIPATFSNALRGMMNDTPSLRWNYSQLFSFFEGKQVSYGPTSATERPKRALNINGEKVYMPHDVVYMLHSNIDEAYSLILNGKISDWAKNGLENEALAAKIDVIVRQEKSAAGNKNLTVARIACLIDPILPIKFKDMAFFPDGIAKATFMALKEKKNLKPFVEIFDSDLIKLWYQEQESLRSPGNITEFRVYIMRQEIGYGIERIIYDFDNDLPCVSPLFNGEIVIGAPQVLRALNNAFKKENISLPPYDRTIIAFLRCKIGKKIDSLISDLNSPREENHVAAILHLYAMLQNKFGPAELPNLARWLVNFSKPLVRIYHNKKYQRYLEKELLKSNSGKLYEIVELLENESALEKDRTDYAAVLNEANYLSLEKNRIENGGPKLDEEARASALKLVSVLSILAMTASFAYNLISWVLK